MKNKLKIIIPIGIAIIAIALAFVFIRFTPSQKADIKAIISTAQQYIIEQNYEAAIAQFKKAIEIDPKNVDAYIGIAQAYEGLGDTDKAIEWLEKGYDITDDERIKEMLDELLAVSNEETAITAEEDTVNEQDNEQEEELFEIEEEMVSFVVPYTIEKQGAEIYSDIDNVNYGDFDISYYDYDNGSGKLYSFYNAIPENQYGRRTSIIGISKSYNYPEKWTVSGYSQNYKPDPLSKYSLPVSLYHTDGTPFLQVKEKYNKNSQLVKREYYDENGSVFTDEYEYDENGYVVKVNTVSKSTTQSVDYKYDSRGNIIECSYGGDYVIKYEYDSKNNLIKETGNGYSNEYSYDPAGNCLTVQEYSNGSLTYLYNYEYYADGTLSRYYFEYNDYYVDGEKSYSEDKYDPAGNIVETCYSSMRLYTGTMNGVEYSEYKRENTKGTYDEHGNRTRQITTEDGVTTIDIIYTNSYDSNGRLIKRVTTDKDEFGTDIDTDEYEYDGNGNLIKETWSGSWGNSSYTAYTYNYDNKLLTKTYYFDGEEWTRYEYEYNLQGNAVKCTCYYKGEYKGSEEVTEFVRIDIPKYIFDAIAEK